MSINYSTFTSLGEIRPPPVFPQRDLASLVRELRLMQRRCRRQVRNDAAKEEAWKLAAIVDRELGLLPWE